MENQQIYKKLNYLEQEIEKLRILLAINIHKKKKKLASIKGLWKGLKIKGEDIEEAKNFLEKEYGIRN